MKRRRMSRKQRVEDSNDTYGLSEKDLDDADERAKFLAEQEKKQKLAREEASKRIHKALNKQKNKSARRQALLAERRAESGIHPDTDDTRLARREKNRIDKLGQSLDTEMILASPIEQEITAQAKQREYIQLNIQKTINSAVSSINGQLSLAAQGSDKATSLREMEVTKHKANLALDAIGKLIQLSHLYELSAGEHSRFKRSAEMRVLNPLLQGLQRAAKIANKSLLVIQERLDVELEADEIDFGRVSMFQASYNDALDSLAKTVSIAEKTIKLERESGARDNDNMAKALSVSYLATLDPVTPPGNNISVVSTVPTQGDTPAIEHQGGIKRLSPSQMRQIVENSLEEKDYVTETGQEIPFTIEGEDIEEEEKDAVKEQDEETEIEPMFENEFTSEEFITPPSFTVIQRKSQQNDPDKQEAKQENITHSEQPFKEKSILQDQKPIISHEAPRFFAPSLHGVPQTHSSSEPLQEQRLPSSEQPTARKEEPSFNPATYRSFVPPIGAVAVGSVKYTNPVLFGFGSTSTIEGEDEVEKPITPQSLPPPPTPINETPQARIRRKLQERSSVLSDSFPVSAEDDSQGMLLSHVIDLPDSTVNALGQHVSAEVEDEKTLKQPEEEDLLSPGVESILDQEVDAEGEEEEENVIDE